MCLQNDVKLLVSDVLQLMKEKWNHTVYDFKCDSLDYRILQRDKTVIWNIPTKTPQFLSSQKYKESHLIWSFIIIHADGVRVIKVIVHPKKWKFSRNCTCMTYFLTWNKKRIVYQNVQAALFPYSERRNWVVKLQKDKNTDLIWHIHHIFQVLYVCFPPKILIYTLDGSNSSSVILSNSLSFYYCKRSSITLIPIFF